MLNAFRIWLLEKNYSVLTSEDYRGRIERLCKKEQFTLEHLAKNIKSILPLYEQNGSKACYGRRSHGSVRASLHHFSAFLSDCSVKFENAN